MRWAWRICSIIQIAYPGCIALGHIIRERQKHEHDGVVQVILCIGLFAYFLARSMSVILVFYAFWVLPPGVYDTVSWSIPHSQRTNLHGSLIPQIIRLREPRRDGKSRAGLTNKREPVDAAT